MLGPRVVVFWNRMCRTGLELEIKAGSPDTPG